MDILEVLEMGRKLGETEMMLRAAEKTARKAARGGKFWKFVALAEAGVIAYAIYTNTKKDEEAIIDDDFFEDDSTDI